jgi:Toprim domain
LKELPDKVSTDVPKRKGGFFALYNSLNGRASTSSTSKPKKATTKPGKADKTVSKEEKELSISTKTISKEKKKASRTSTRAKKDAEAELSNRASTEAKKPGRVSNEKKRASRASTSQTKQDAGAEIPEETLLKSENSKTIKKTKKSTSARSTKEVAVPKSSKKSSKTKKSSNGASSPENLAKASTVKAPSKAKMSRTDKKENIAKTSSSRKGSSRSSSSINDSNAVPESVNGPVKRGRPHDFQPLYPPTGKSVVVVESATKAKVIQNYLGSMYEVVASYGHVRDLAGRSKSVRPDEDFSMVWEVPHAAWTHLKSIRDALNGYIYIYICYQCT